MKRKKLILLLSATALVIISVFALSQFWGEEKTAYNFFAFDTAGTVTLYDAPDDLLPSLRDTVDSLDKKLNGFDENSALAELNSSRHSSDKPLFEIIEKSIELYKRYGYTDITVGSLIYLWNISDGGKTVPDDEQINSAMSEVGVQNVTLNDKEVLLSGNTEIELGAVAKGYALDKVRELFSSFKPKGAVADFGSSVLLYGKDRTFTVDIQSPFESDEKIGRLEISDTFISTSGGYERFVEHDGKKYAHILDSKTGYPVKSDFASVTVICNSGILSDFLSTAIYIMGKDELLKHMDSLRKDGIEVIAVCEDKEILISQGLKDNFYTNIESDNITII